MNLKYRRKILRRFIFLPGAFLLLSCGFPGIPGFLEVRLPEISEAWPGMEDLIGFRLVYPDGGSQSEIGSLRPGETVRIPHRLGEKIPVAAFPLFEPAGPAGEGMKPAGGVFPLSADGPGGIRLSWKDGFLASCLLTVYANTGSLEWINLEKLRESIEEEAPEDPWTLDASRLIRPLIYGRFYSGFIRSRETYLVPYTAETAGWYMGDPLLSVPEEPEEPLELYPGIHRRISPGGERWADIRVDERGWLILLQPEATVLEGDW